MTLIEVLVALLVLSIGLLGSRRIADDQSLEQPRRAPALAGQILAHDIADRMRANRKAAEDGAYDRRLGEIPTGETGWPFTSGRVESTLATGAAGWSGRSSGVPTATWRGSDPVDRTLGDDQFFTETDLRRAMKSKQKRD